MFEILLGLFIAYVILKMVLLCLDIRNAQKASDDRPVLMDKEPFVLAKRYTIKKHKVEIVELIVELMLLLFWFNGGLKALEQLLNPVDSPLNTVGFLLLFLAANMIATLPLGIYRSMWLDKEFGFSNMTPKLFVVDFVKSLLMLVVLGGVVVYGGYYLLQGQWWWLYGFGLMMAIVVLANLLMPLLMMAFNSFKPLEDKELLAAITKLMQRANMDSKGVFVMDASRRDSRLNAFFGGIGSAKRVVLYDTLVQSLTPNEILAVMAHELGHFRHKDIVKNIAMMALVLFGGFYLFSLFDDAFFAHIGVVKSQASLMAVVMLMLPMVLFWATPLISAVSRSCEYAADRYSASEVDSVHLASALKKLVEHNKSFTLSHRLYSLFFHTHPSVVERLRALGEL